ncbi:DM13 domain-containing protein [Micromonospora sp. KC723]|uniref:DM13 domain-containing protein n=1 Tax=Micromonospora sp. KC723 TaxID=2530381 RepID=UPI00104E1662|nr:DM13 domain-containing protein [Micromonospora sp. KC723]TDB76575.1 hypothetical protein E1165_06690 [Micromonospora sp. KC723]
MVRLSRTPLTWFVVSVLVVATAFGLYWFQPWKLATDTRVDERLSGVVEPATVGPAATGPTAAPTADAPVVPAGPVLVSRGQFVTHEHDTSGTARVVRADDGSHRLELVGLSTSNGPDLRVWLSDQPVRTGRAGWDVFDDGRWVELGRLKGNRGDQVYGIPAGTDLAGLTSVSIWCKRFSVSFGAAPLTPVG